MKKPRAYVWASGALHEVCRVVGVEARGVKCVARALHIKVIRFLYAGGVPARGAAAVKQCYALPDEMALLGGQDLMIVLRQMSADMYRTLLLNDGIYDMVRTKLSDTYAFYFRCGGKAPWSFCIR